MDAATGLTKDYLELAQKNYDDEAKSAETLEKERVVWDNSSWLKRIWWILVGFMLAFNQQISMHKSFEEFEKILKQRKRSQRSSKKGSLEEADSNSTANSLRSKKKEKNVDSEVKSLNGE